MTGSKPSTERRCRGRPQLRPDDETRQIIYEAARHEFAVNGFAATSTEMVARSAGVSTKTLYRLIPNKAALFEGMVSDRLERFLSDFNLHADDADIEEAMNAALMACAGLALDPEVVALQRLVLKEADQFPGLAEMFYEKGIQRNTEALAAWLRTRAKRGSIVISDTGEAAGILIGMVVLAPLRAANYGDVALPVRAELERRVRTCVSLFLRGCLRQEVQSSSA
jgi:AcrR family transcriptional regulator